MDPTVPDLSDTLLHQLKVIKGVHTKLTAVVSSTDKIFTSLTYNLMREQRIIDSGVRDGDAWSLKAIPDYPPASRALLQGDVQTAAKLAAAFLIESDFDRLEALLNEASDYVGSFEKSVSRLVAMQSLQLQPNTPASSPQPKAGGRRPGHGETQAEMHLISWSALVGEAKALLARLLADMDFRRGLLRYIAKCVVESPARGDFDAPQRVCFLWRQAVEAVRWESFLELANHLGA
ncbi:hypothetical protein AAHC03_05762 [Spirometra sp. Aus1]